MSKAWALLLPALCAVAACSGGGTGAVGPVPTANPSPTPAPSALATATATATAKPSAVVPASPSSSATPSSAPTTMPSPAVVVNANAGPAISPLVLGANLAFWYDVTQSGIGASLGSSGFTAVRWPGGSSSDEYHWQTHTTCPGAYANPNSTFGTFMRDVVQPAQLDVAVTLDYGSNAACNGGGDPNEAAAWVHDAKSKNYGVHYWTVGNEVYGSWEYDLHAVPHDPATYANAVATGYYPAIKAQDATAQVGVVAQPGGSWDPVVLSSAHYDFVEYHFYAQAPGQESDAYLLTQAPQALTLGVRQVQADLAAAGHANTPVYVGELGSVYGSPGKQSTSIVQALYAGMALNELMNDGVFRATWWLAYGGCSDATNGNFAASLYGWQNFGGYMMFSDGTPEYGCANATAVPRGTPLPTVRAFQVLAQVARAGEHVLGTSVNGGLASVRAYAATHGSGYAVTLYNLSETTSVTVPVALAGLTHGSSIVSTTYGKTQYDDSRRNVWTGPVTSTAGPFTGEFVVTLPPWSMTVALVSP